MRNYVRLNLDLVMLEDLLVLEKVDDCLTEVLEDLLEDLMNLNLMNLILKKSVVAVFLKKRSSFFFLVYCNVLGRNHCIGVDQQKNTRRLHTTPCYD